MSLSMIKAPKTVIALQTFITVVLYALYYISLYSRIKILVLKYLYRLPLYRKFPMLQKT